SFSSERSYTQTQPGSNCGTIPRPSPVLELARRAALGPVSTPFLVLHRVQVRADQASHEPGLQTGPGLPYKPFGINNFKMSLENEQVEQGTGPKMSGEKSRTLVPSTPPNAAPMLWSRAFWPREP